MSNNNQAAFSASLVEVKTDCVITKDLKITGQPAQRIIEGTLQGVAPLETIMSNAGFNPKAVLAQLNASNDEYLTLDTQHNRYGNFLAIGIIDPVKVMRLALRNAVSVVSTLITTETVVMNVPDLSMMAGYSPEWAAATREDPRL